MSVFSENVTHNSVPDALAYLIEEIHDMKDILRNRDEKTESNSNPKYERLTRNELCERYKISLPTLHKLMIAGLPFEKIGRKTLFRRGDVDAFIKQRQNSLKKG